MIRIRALRGRLRRPATAFPAAALALALSCAGVLAAQPATAADGPPGLPSAAAAALAVAPQHTAPDKELRSRVVDAAKTQATEKKAAGKTPYIIGGTETTISSAPWMVQLAYYDATTGDGYFCGGTLVAPNKVLTAAHCVAGLDWTKNGAVLAGATGLYDDTTGTVAGVLHQWNHPRFNATTAQNDIAVLTLDRPLDEQWMRLAYLNDLGYVTPGRTATVYGWGLTSGTGTDLSANLRKATLPIVDDATCDSAMKSVLGDDEFIEGSMFCAGTPASGTDEGTTSPCNGDSGGPVIVDNKVIGIVSWGVAGCTAKGAYPVFTKVGSYAWAAQPRIDDTDMSFDGRADILGRTPSGGLFEQDSKGTSLAQRAYLGSGWQTASWGLQADLDRDYYQDLIVRDKTDGHLYRDYLDHSTGAYEWMQISSVWGGYKSYAIPGDLTGDARPDLVAVDADGSVYLYPGKGNGQFYGKVKVVDKAWKNVTIFGHGDLTGDGRADLLVRNSSGVLYLYAGTQVEKAPWKPRVQARTGWNFTSYVSNGDVTGDGIADVVTRDSGGTLWLYPGTDKATTALFGTRIKLGTGYNQYNLLF
ncbi:trypsin-like serine protease [Streptomyces sp. NPDC050508]|uniref:trypsin-like serine protease n=1 Tax=Streptomyces sp. NPDC050508 TaxID=3155405 RepID=UPI003439DEC3